MKKAQNLYCDNYRTLAKETKGLNKWNNIYVHGSDLILLKWQQDGL
jgi:hypothetical protein